jgi:hypothetical protein
LTVCLSGFSENRESILSFVVGWLSFWEVEKLQPLFSEEETTLKLICSGNSMPERAEPLGLLRLLWFPAIAMKTTEKTRRMVNINDTLEEEEAIERKKETFFFLFVSRENPSPM